MIDEDGFHVPDEPSIADPPYVFGDHAAVCRGCSDCDRLEALEREVERLRDRLRPFAEFLDALDVHGGWDPPDGWIVRIDTDPPVTLAYEELVRARQALLDDRTETP